MGWKIVTLSSLLVLGGCIDLESNSESRDAWDRNIDAEPNNDFVSAQELEVPNDYPEKKSFQLMVGASGELHSVNDPIDTYEFTMKFPSGFFLMEAGSDRIDFVSHLEGYISPIYSIYENDKLLTTFTPNKNRSWALKYIWLSQDNNYKISVEALTEARRYWFWFHSSTKQFPGHDITQFTDIPTSTSEYSSYNRYYDRHDDQSVIIYQTDAMDQSLCRQKKLATAEIAEEIMAISDFEIGQCNEVLGNDVIGHCELRYSYWENNNDAPSSGNSYQTREPAAHYGADGGYGYHGEVVFFTHQYEMNEAALKCMEMRGGFFNQLP